MWARVRCACVGHRCDAHGQTDSCNAACPALNGAAGNSILPLVVVDDDTAFASWCHIECSECVRLTDWTVDGECRARASPGSRRARIDAQSCVHGWTHKRRSAAGASALISAGQPPRTCVHVFASPGAHLQNHDGVRIAQGILHGGRWPCSIAPSLARR